MAQIAGLAKQQEALKDISATLVLIKKLNKFFETDTEDLITVSIGSVKANILPQDKPNLEILVRNYKSTLVEHINFILQQYPIELNEEEKLLLER